MPPSHFHWVYLWVCLHSLQQQVLEPMSTDVRLLKDSENGHVDTVAQVLKSKPLPKFQSPSLTIYTAIFGAPVQAWVC